MRIQKYFTLALIFFVSLQLSAQEIRKVKITELEKIIADTKTPLVINFWATFCKPCIEEMPHLLEMTKKYQKDSVRLLLVSLDLEESYPIKIRDFVTKRKIKSPVVWLDEFDADYFIPKIDSAWTGAIPATLFINPKTGYRKFVEEQFTAEKLDAKVRELLGR